MHVAIIVFVILAIDSFLSASFGKEGEWTKKADMPIKRDSFFKCKIIGDRDEHRWIL